MGVSREQQPPSAYGWLAPLLFVVGLVLVGYGFPQPADRDERPAPAPAPAPAPPAPPQPTPGPPSVWELLIAAHNQVRQQHALAPLQPDDKLAAVAQAWAESMAERRSLVHQNLNRLGDWSQCGENIAYGQADVDSVMRTWLASPGHRRNILHGGYGCIGVGVAAAKDGRLYWCVDFGGRSGAPPSWSTQPDF